MSSRTSSFRDNGLTAFCYFVRDTLKGHHLFIFPLELIVLIAQHPKQKEA